MQEFQFCHRVIFAKKCGGTLKLWKDNPTSRVKICNSCGQKYYFSPHYECDYHDHQIYQEAYQEGAACHAGS
jgi:hypothetical protein